MTPKIIIGDDSDDNIKLIECGLEGLDGVSTLKLQPDKLRELPGLDAIYLSLSMAEAWGARPDFYKAQVISTSNKNPEALQSSQLPPYIVTGVAIRRDDPRVNDPIFQLRLIVSAVLEAATEFNRVNHNAIRNIAFWSESLLLGQINPKQIGEEIREIYRTISVNERN